MSTNLFMKKVRPGIKLIRSHLPSIAKIFQIKPYILLGKVHTLKTIKIELKTEIILFLTFPMPHKFSSSLWPHLLEKGNLK